ncbi:MAG TPA: dATP pyrophosphohydrolase [Dongiaceae bacterium]|jgi:hypothetical protein|nr:dATP pyrophosphohydrolase [Dongiaceae bacterium]
MPADIRLVEDAMGRADFIALPKSLYRGHAGYVAHLDMERKDTLDRRRNPYFDHAQAALFVAYAHGRPVGRVSAQLCRLFQEKHGEQIGHFGFLDAEDDPALVRDLLDRAAQWLRERGARVMLGPFHFSINEEIGLMVEGFMSRPMIMMPYHPPYLGAHVAAAGFEKAKDVLAYDLPTAAYRPMGGGRLLARMGAESRLRVRSLQAHRMEEEVRAFFDIYNDAWSQNWGMIPFTDAEARAATKALKPLIVPDLVRVAELDGVPVAMLLCLPNLNEAISDLGGRLLPFGWAKLLWRLKANRLQSARIALMGIRKKYQGTPASSAMLALMFDSLVAPARARGFRHIELSWILEDNQPMRRVIEAIGGKPYKTFRLYERPLA